MRTCNCPRHNWANAVCRHTVSSNFPKRLMGWSFPYGEPMAAIKDEGRRSHHPRSWLGMTFLRRKGPFTEGMHIDLREGLTVEICNIDHGILRVDGNGVGTDTRREGRQRPVRGAIDHCN